MSYPLVSDIIPTYYRNKSLTEALDSAINQNYDNTQIIVVDASGDAHAQSVVQDKTVEYIALGEDPGIAGTRYIGINSTDGKCIRFLASFLGRPGRDFARQIHSRYLLGEHYEGKIA